MLLPVHCFDCIAKVLCFSKLKVTGWPIFQNYNLACFIGLSVLNPASIYNQEFVVVNYNTKIMSVINDEDVSVYRVPWPLWHFMWHCLVVRSCYLKAQMSEAIFYHFLYVSIHVKPVYGSDAAVLESCLLALQVLLFFCFSWQCHLYQIIS